MTKSKLPEPPELPDTKELIEPLRKLFDYLQHNLNGHWNEIPQYAALEKLFSQYPMIREDIIWRLRVAIAEKDHGSWPRFKLVAHPLCDELDVTINELIELAENGGGHNDELRYLQARNRLLEDPEVGARIPKSLKAAVSLRSFKEQISLLMGDCTDEKVKPEVIRDEFLDLTNWLRGQLVHGSPEWIAFQTWVSKMHLIETSHTMTMMKLLRDAVVARVPERVRQEHWEQFVEKEFSNEPFMPHALIIAWEAWNAVYSRDKLAMKEAFVDKDTPVKQKTSKRASRR